MSLGCCLQKQNAVPGSCTALVAVLRPSNGLEVCLVGDAGLRLVRGGRVAAATEVGRQQSQLASGGASTPTLRQGHTWPVW